MKLGELLARFRFLDTNKEVRVLVDGKSRPLIDLEIVDVRLVAGDDEDDETMKVIETLIGVPASADIPPVIVGDEVAPKWSSVPVINVPTKPEKRR